MKNQRIKQKLFLVILAFTLINIFTILPLTVEASIYDVIATKLGESPNWPDYSIGGSWGVNPWCPQIYFPYQNRHHVILILSDELRDWDLSTGVASTYKYSSAIPLSGNTEYKLHTINYTITDSALRVFVYCSPEPRFNVSIYRLDYDIVTHVRSVVFQKNVTYHPTIEVGPGTMSNSAVFYNYLLISGEGAEEGKVYRIDLRNDDKVTYSNGSIFYYISDKLFTRTSDGVECVYIGKHLAGSKHQVINLQTMTFVAELDASGGGSPRSPANNPYKSGSTIYVPLCNGGVVNTNNTIMWYDPTNLTKIYETGFPLYDANGQFRDDFGGYPEDWFNWPYGMCIIARLTNGHYFAIGNINQCHAWFVLDANLLLYDYGVLTDYASDWYGAMSWYGDGSDPTNWPIIDRESETVYCITNIQEGSKYRLDLWEIDYSSLSVDSNTFNEYCNWLTYTSPGQTPGGVEVNISNLPGQIGISLGIGTFAGGLFLSSVMLLSFVLPVAWKTRGFIPSVMIGLVVCGFLVAIGWLPYWLLLLVALMVAGLWAMISRNVFMG